MTTYHHKALMQLAVVLLLSPLIACSSTRIVKNYGDKGMVTDITVFEKDTVKSRIVFEYDQAGRVISISKYAGQDTQPAAARRFVYDFFGKLVFQTHRALVPHDDKGIDDAWVESFFYGYTGELIRCETSYKSSYAISRHKSPLVVTSYAYNNNILEKIATDGGVFRKDFTIVYADEVPVEIEYREQALNRETYAFETAAHLRFFLKKGVPVKAENRSSGAMITNKAQVRALYEEGEVVETLNKPLHTANLESLLKEIESDWVR
ncbi:MAG: hypothetical protein EPN93_10040 [Spirochaetes bacterium]|nr:MAG: hypothetical protein EPN93_10040 [Spirochaetota bacterium]